MKKTNNQPHIVSTISELHRILRLPRPEHPLVSLINLDEIDYYSEEELSSVVYNFYSICIKKK